MYRSSVPRSSAAVRGWHCHNRNRPSRHVLSHGSTVYVGHANRLWRPIRGRCSQGAPHGTLASSQAFCPLVYAATTPCAYTLARTCRSSKKPQLAEQNQFPLWLTPPVSGLANVIVPVRSSTESAASRAAQGHRAGGFSLGATDNDD
eukprot:UN03333